MDHTTHVETREPEAINQPAQASPPTATTADHTESTAATNAAADGAVSDQPVKDHVVHQTETDHSPKAGLQKPAGWLLRLPFRLTNKTMIIIAGIILLLLAAGSGGAIYWRAVSAPTPAPATAPTIATNTSNNSSGSTTTPSQSPTISDSISDDTFTPTKTISGISLLAKPVLLADLHFFSKYDTFFTTSCTDSTCSNRVSNVSGQSLTYYQIGTTADGHRIVNASAYDPGDVSGIIYNFVAIDSGDGKFTLYAITSRIRKTDVASLQLALSPNITVDTATSITALALPHTITIPSYTSKNIHATLTLSYNYNNLEFESTGQTTLPRFYSAAHPGLQPIAFGESNGIVAYTFNLSKDPNYQAILWVVTVHNLYTVQYMISNPLDVPDSPTATPIAIGWTSGTSNRSFYDSNLGSGCGFPNTYGVLPNLFDTTSLTKVGNTPKGETVNELPNAQPLLQNLYDDYKSRSSFIETDSLKNLSLDQFQAAHAVIITQNSANEYVVGLRGELFPGGGCGKPVVYLYPSAPTYVDVSVGAQVVKAEPAYPMQTGWQQVLAQPDGQLTYRGTAYSSLYWEGYGHGSYPEITNGTVVATFLAPSTIRRQLAEQGLTPHEISDFMAFWGDKLPKTPYTRLTWFNTPQLQQLAPLTVSPRADTMIRVFLDFEGLEQPIQIAPQHFQAPIRAGFTVVEWGGLLRGGIH